MKRSASIFTTIATSLLATAAGAAVHNVGPQDDLFSLLQTLQAGDEVIVAAGTYQTPGFYEVTWTGTQAAPIVVRAADGARPVIQGDPSENIMNVEGSHFTLKGFELKGGSHGIRFGNADHATLDDLVIHDIDDVGISCNRPGMTCDALNIINNEIYDTGKTGNGEGMYIGCNDAKCVVKNSVFQGNYLHQMGGDQGDGIEIKTGSFGNIVRDNVIVDTKYPAITMYGFASGAKNLVEGNLVWGTVDNGIQIVGQVTVRNNIVINAGSNGIQSKPSQGFEPKDLEIVHNTIVNAAGPCMKSNGWDSQSGQIVANNAFYCPGGTAMDINGGAPGGTFAANFVLGSDNAPSGSTPGTNLMADLGDPSSQVFYPPVGSPLIDAGDPGYAVSVDFNGTKRDSKPDVGAYEVTTADNPGWKINAGFKGSSSASGGGTGAASGAGGGNAASSDDGGCGCRASGDSSRGHWSALLGLLAGLGLRRRRRRAYTDR